MFLAATTNHGQKKGANPSHPRQRHREAPVERMHRAAPDGRVLSGLASALKNSRFFDEAVAESYAKYVLIILFYVDSV